MRTDYIRKEGDLFVLDGAFGTVYNVDTVESIDANLEGLRPDHPDVDRLLDARKLIGPLNAIWPSKAPESNGDDSTGVSAATEASGGAGEAQEGTDG